MMKALKEKIKEKLEADLKDAKEIGDKRQLMVRRMLDNEKKLNAKIADLESSKPKEQNSMMIAFKAKIKDKLDQDLKAAKATGDKRQLMVRRMLDNEKKLQARIVELEEN